ncbi:hypothetical protein GCM10009422_06850 [Brevundimonas kwangchunensis]|uniref:DUF4287 domain-containing protein n=1 Tax=Brevundimonas kwangchunensis TaxID=322163 RepID=A0ABN1GMF8_9CAUL
MSFQAYLDNVQTKTGKSPDALKALAEAAGLVSGDDLAHGVKATQVTDWLKSEFDLGHGHAMSIYAYFKGKRS